MTQQAGPARLVIDADGRIRHADAAAITLVGAGAGLAGRTAADFLHLPERMVVAAAFVQARDEGTPATVVVRLIPASGLPVQVRCRFAALADGTVETILVPDAQATPSADREPVRFARQVLGARAATRRAFPQLAMAGDGADVLMEALVHEADGAPLTPASLASRLGGPAQIVHRWLAALRRDGLVRPAAATGDALLLAPDARQQLGALLGGPTLETSAD